MDAQSLRELVLKAIGKKPENEPENPAFDSLDKLEIITALHDTFDDKVSNIDDLDNFSDLETLTSMLQSHAVIN